MVKVRSGFLLSELTGKERHASITLVLSISAVLVHVRTVAGSTAQLRDAWKSMYQCSQELHQTASHASTLIKCFSNAKVTWACFSFHFIEKIAFFRSGAAGWPSICRFDSDLFHVMIILLLDQDPSFIASQKPWYNKGIAQTLESDSPKLEQGLTLEALWKLTCH